MWFRGRPIFEHAPGIFNAPLERAFKPQVRSNLGQRDRPQTSHLSAGILQRGERPSFSGRDQFAAPVFVRRAARSPVRAAAPCSRSSRRSRPSRFRSRIPARIGWRCRRAAAAITALARRPLTPVGQFQRMTTRRDAGSLSTWIEIRLGMLDICRVRAPSRHNVRSRRPTCLAYGSAHAQSIAGQTNTASRANWLELVTPNWRLGARTHLPIESHVEKWDGEQEGVLFVEAVKCLPMTCIGR